MPLMLITLGIGQMWADIAYGTYVPCSSTDDLAANAHYIITNGTSGSVKCISNASNNNNRKTVAASVSDSKISVADNSTIMTLTLGGSSGAWTFYTDNYGGTAGYLASAASGNNNYCRVITTSTTGTISFSNSAAVITLNPHTSRNILRYNTSDLFACYSSGQNAVYLFRKAVQGVSNNTNYGTVSVAGDVITASPKSGYRVSTSNPYTISPTGKATVSQSGNVFTLTNVSALVTLTVNFEEDVQSFDITAQSNNTTYGTVSKSGSIITGSPKANCRYASPAYSVSPANSATVSQNGNEFIVTPSANTTVTINFEPLPTHSIHFNTGGLVDIADATGIQEGTIYNISQTPAASLTEHCEFGTFVGWTTASSIANPNVKPTIITSYEMGNADVTLYAVYKKIEGELSEVTINFGYGDWGKTAQFSGTDFDDLSQKVEGVTVTDVRNTGSLYANSTSTRFYKANELTFASDENITTIVFTVSSYQTDITANVGTCTATSTEFSWEGTAKSVTFTRPSNASSYAQFSSAKVIVGNGTTTYSLDANCCSPLGQINGSVSMTQTTAALEWADLANVSSWAIQYKEHGAQNWNTWNGAQATNNNKRSVTITNLSCGTAYDFKIAATAAPGYCDAEQVIENQSTTKWNISYTLTNTVGLSEGPAQGANACGEISATFSKNESYTFPDEITVTIGGNTATVDDDYLWDADGGVLYIDAAHVTGNITVAIEGVAPAIPTLVATPDVLNFGTPKQGADVPTAQTFRISGTALTAGDITITAPAGYTVSPSQLTGIAAGTLEASAATEITVTPKSTSTAGECNQTITISGCGASSINVAANMNVQATYTVNWWINGGENPASSLTDVEGTEVVAPTYPDDFSAFTDCSDFYFVGWATSAISGNEGTTTEPSIVTPITEIGTANVDYYAVFAEGTPGGNVLVTSTSELTNGTKVYLYSTFEVSEVTYGVVAKAFVSGNNVRSTSGTVSNNKLTPGEDAGLYTIGVTENGYTFNDGTYYLRATGSDKNWLVGAAELGDDQKGEFAITISENVASISSVGNTSRGVMQFNKNSDTGDYTKAIFSCYSGANYNGIQLFKQSTPVYNKWYTTCPHVTRVNLSAEGVENGSITFAKGGNAITSIATAGENPVTVDVVPDPETGYELTGVALSGVAGASYAAGVITIPANAEGTLLATATFSPIMVTEVALDRTSLDVDLGASPVELHATCTPAEALDKTVTWTTSNGEVATVANGTVTFFAAGKATITATCNEHSATCLVTVNPTPDVVLDFTDNDTWNFPLQADKGTTEQSFSKGGYTVKVAGANGYYFDNNNLLIGKQDAYMELPAFNKPIDKIVCTGVSGGSSGVTRVVLRGEEIVSEAVQTGCTVDKTFNLEPQEQADLYVYTIKVTNGNNARFAKIKIYLGEVASVLRPTISGAVNFVESAEVTLNCATEGATIYYTINGESPKTSEGKILYSEPFSVTENTIVKAAAYKEGDWSAISTKTFTKGTLYTVGQALEAIEALDDNEETDEVFVEGIISTLDSYTSYNNSIQYRISADGSTTNQLYVHNGKGLDGANFEALTDLELEDIVIVFGKLKKYVDDNGTKFEVNSPNYIYSLNRRPSAGLAWSAATATVGIEGDKNYATLTNPNGVAVTYSSSNPDVATISNEEGHEGEISLVAAGTTTISASFIANETYKSATVSYELEVRDILVYASISYELDGANEDIEDVDVATNLPNPLPTVTKDGHHFGGWFTDATFETPAVAGAPLTGNTTLYVKWIEIPTFNNSGYEWQLVMSEDQLVAGKYYVLASSSEDVVASNISSNIMGTESAAFEDDVIAYNGFGDSQIADASNAIVFQLGGETGAWTFDEAVHQYGLLGYNGDKKVQWGGSNTTWTIALADNNATIVPVDASTYHILYNVNNPRFTVYNSNPSASMLLPQLYVWAPKIYKVIYDANGGSNAPAAAKANVDGKAIVTSSIPTAPANKIFYCWNENAEGTGAMYYAGDKVAATDADVTIYATWRDLPKPAENGIAEIGGKFIISNLGDTAVFSRGNLQHQMSTNTWRTAPNQYDWAGVAANKQIGNLAYEGWVDLFCWSLGDANNYGATSAYHSADYYNKNFVDWGGLFEGDWATLSSTQWKYLLNSRSGANDKWGMAMIGDNLGMILLPEEWTAPAGINFVPRTNPTSDLWDENDRLDPSTQDHCRVKPENMPANKFTLEEWAQLEAAGAIFLPYAGRRSGGYGNHTDRLDQEVNYEYNFTYYENYLGTYWTSTMSNPEEGKADYVYTLNCKKVNNEDVYSWGKAVVWGENGRYGQSVRLVHIIPRRYTVTYDANGATSGSVPVNENTYLDGATVPVADKGDLAKEGYAFAGWKFKGTTYKAGDNYTIENVKYNENIVFEAQWSEPSDYVLVTKATQLVAGDQIIIAAAGNYDYAMGTEHTSGNYRNRVEIAKTEDKKRICLLAEEPVAFTLNVSGNYFTFYKEGEGYLCAQNTDNNYLKTEESLTDYGKWSVDISDGEATVIAQGTYTSGKVHNEMRYNKTSGTERMSCYKSNSDQPKVALYKIPRPVVVPENGSIDASDIATNTSVTVEKGATLAVDEDNDLDNLTVEAGGTVSGDEKLTVNNLIIKTTLSTITSADQDEDMPSQSGQIALSNDDIKAQGDVFIEITLTQLDVTSGWYAFSVPFPVSAAQGIYYGNTQLTRETEYAIMAYHEELRAAGQYAWKKYYDIMRPGQLYIIAVGDTDYKTLLFKKEANADIVASNSVAVSNTAASGQGQSGWNGLGNPNQQIAQMDGDLQFLDHENNCFHVRLGSETSLSVGSAFMYQYTGSEESIVIEARTGSGALLAPAREPQAIEKATFRVKLINEATGKAEDIVYLRTSEEATNTYEIGRDLGKMSMGTAKCAQMSIPAYGTQLCIADFPLVNNQVTYPLSINTPKAGSYSLVAPNAENADIYLTHEDAIIWNLSESAYTIDLNKGTTTGYGLLLKAKMPQTPTGIENGGMLNGENGVQKVIIDENVFILRGGQMYDVTGKAVK